jgi:hypothetical protein
VGGIGAWEEVGSAIGFPVWFQGLRSGGTITKGGPRATNLLTTGYPLPYFQQTLMISHLERDKDEQLSRRNLCVDY